MKFSAVFKESSLKVDVHYEAAKTHDRRRNNILNDSDKDI